jgi:hypothetical protein
MRPPLEDTHPRSDDPHKLEPTNDSADRDNERKKVSDLTRSDRVATNQCYRLHPLVPPTGARGLLGTGEPWQRKPRQDTAPPLIHVPSTGERVLPGTEDSGQRNPRQDSTPEDVIMPSDSHNGMHTTTNSIGLSSAVPVSEHIIDETKRTKKKHQRKLKRGKESDNWKTANEGHHSTTVMHELQRDPMTPLSAGRLEISVPYASVLSDHGLPRYEGNRNSHKQKKERKLRGAEYCDHEATANITTPNAVMQATGFDLPQITMEKLQPEEYGQDRPAIGLQMPVLNDMALSEYSTTKKKKKKKKHKRKKEEGDLQTKA